ncbi:hypothetical protein EII34_15590 [Arachnia propionica]|uniref:Uncharacterized protein n=1 Tax=Arachnia propionica TaxID=1750 RepID=A0A3P1T315_9ACTN|nr:DUF6301 family protein [Arachnia propionica]RRD02863.1 hypothetical protein EII34_15590 [Arachnia propionica]
MKSIPVDEVVRLAEYFVGLDWPLSREQGYAACEALGWPGTGDGRFVMPYGLRHLDKASVSAGRRGDDVAEVQFRLTDVVRDETPERDGFMNNVFTGCVAEFRGLWGKGKMKRGKLSQAAHWDTQNGCHLVVRNSWKSVSFVLYSPSFTEVLKSLGDL